MYICHIDDIHSYLVAFTTITNGVAILDPEFTELEVLKSIFTVIALIRFHLTRLFHTSLWMIQQFTQPYSKPSLHFTKRC